MDNVLDVSHVLGRITVLLPRSPVSSVGRFPYLVLVYVIYAEKPSLLVSLRYVLGVSQMSIIAVVVFRPLFLYGGVS